MNKDNISWGISFDKQIENFIIAYEKALKLATDCYSINNELAYYLYKQLQACQEQVATKTDECEGLRRKNTNQSIKIGDLLHIISENEHYIKVVIPEEFKEIIQENTTLKQQLDTAVEALEYEFDLLNSKELNVVSDEYKQYKRVKTAIDKIKGEPHEK